MYCDSRYGGIYASARNRRRERNKALCRPAPRRSRPILARLMVISHLLVYREKQR